MRSVERIKRSEREKALFLNIRLRNDYYGNALMERFKMVRISTFLSLAIRPVDRFPLFVPFYVLSWPGFEFTLNRVVWIWLASLMVETRSIWGFGDHQDRHSLVAVKHGFWASQSRFHQYQRYRFPLAVLTMLLRVWIAKVMGCWEICYAGENGVNHGIERIESNVKYSNERLQHFWKTSVALRYFDFTAPKFMVGNGFKLSTDFIGRYDRMYVGSACSEEEEVKSLARCLKTNGTMIVPFNDHVSGILSSGANLAVCRRSVKFS